MRILIATTHRAIVGGVETYLRALMPLLAEQGHDLALIHEFPADPGTPTIDQEQPGLPAWHLDPRERSRSLNAVSAWRPDVVYLQGLKEPAWEEALLDRFPAVLFAHNYHGTCVSGTKCHARPGYGPCTRTLGLGCLTTYFPRRCGGANPLRMIGLYRMQQRRRNTLNRYSAVLVASRHMAEEFRCHGVADARLHVVPLFAAGVNAESVPPPARPRSNRILFVGRITPLKGLAHLIAATQAASAELGQRLNLIVAGDGAARAEAEADVRRRGLPAEFLGWVGSVRVQAEMRRADLLAVPSVWPEPFGLVGVEAGSVGLPAVAFDVGGIADWLHPGVSGEIADGAPPTAAGMANAMVRALRDTDHLQCLRRGAWTVAQEFTSARHVAQLERILDAGLGP